VPGIVRVDTGELEGVLYEYRGRARNLRRVMPVVADALVSAVSDVFEAEGPDWEPLAESTLRQRRGTSSKILQDTGLFAESVTPECGADFAEARAGVAYGEFHATGTKHMPKRNPFDLGPFEADVLEDAADIIAAEVVR
jgi:phage gpG-like protein